jgi:hypothetical protein
MNSVAYSSHVSMSPVVSTVNPDGSSISDETMAFIAAQAKKKGYVNLGGMCVLWGLIGRVCGEVEM